VCVYVLSVVSFTEKAVIFKTVCYLCSVVCIEDYHCKY